MKLKDIPKQSKNTLQEEKENSTTLRKELQHI
jgi:hypothetical protein